MVRIGIVGIGFMGMIHYLASRKLQGAQVTAICSRDQKKLSGDWRSIRGNFGPPGEIMDLSGIKKYPTLEEMLADPDIDLVDICNPTHLHPQTAIKALEAGKHVLVEKAIALKPEEADEMVETARKTGRLLMVAHVLPFFPEFAYTADVIRKETYGKVLGAHFKRIISRPDWSSDIGDAAKTGGPAVDLHIHDTHFIGLTCGVPKRVCSSGITENGAVQYLTTQYLYDDNRAISCSSGAVAQSGRPFVHGFEIYLEHATLAYETGTCPLTAYLPEGKIFHPSLPGGGDETTAFTLEIQTAVQGVLQNKEPDLLSGKLARDALVLCYKEIDSVLDNIPISI